MIEDEECDSWEILTRKLVQRGGRSSHSTSLPMPPGLPRGAPPAVIAALLAVLLCSGAQGGPVSRAGASEHAAAGGAQRARRLHGSAWLLDEQGMPDRIGLAPRKGRHQAACDTIGRALDAIAPLFQRSRANSTAPASSQPMFHPRLL